MLDEVRGPASLDQAPSGRWPALIAAMTASRLSSFSPIRRIAAAAPPVANALLGPFAERSVGLAHVLDLLAASAGSRARLLSTASSPAIDIRTSSNALALVPKIAIASSIIALSAILSSPAASSPTAVVTTSGLPPGVCANPPPGILHDFTNLMHPATSGIDPPT